MLGCDVHVWDDDGNEMKPGEAGELVCVGPFPSMPLRFVDDPDGKRYEAEYFEYYPGKHVWRHGDSVERTEQGQYIIIGRSDATLNQNGVRIGTVAIYDQLRPFGDKIKEAAAIDFTRPDNKQTITVLFLVLPDGANDVPIELRNGIKKAVKDNITPYAIPTEILAVPGILKTPNGKIAEVVMKKVVSGKAIPNASLYGEDLVKNFEEIGRDLHSRYGG
jgi:acetoacetyl-CoA synthetase